MLTIRLKHNFTFHHCEIPEGTIIAVPRDIAHKLVKQEAADLISYETAVVEPQETRVQRRKR